MLRATSGCIWKLAGAGLSGYVMSRAHVVSSSAHPGVVKDSAGSM